MTAPKPTPKLSYLQQQQTHYVLACARWALSHAEFETPDREIIDGIIQHAAKVLKDGDVEMPKTAINPLIKRCKTEFRIDKDATVARRAYAAYAAYSLIRLLGSREGAMRQRHVDVAYSSCQEIAGIKALDLADLDDTLSRFNLREA